MSCILWKASSPNRITSGLFDRFCRTGPALRHRAGRAAPPRNETNLFRRRCVDAIPGQNQFHGALSWHVAENRRHDHHRPQTDVDFGVANCASSAAIAIASQATSKPPRHRVTVDLGDGRPDSAGQHQVQVNKRPCPSVFARSGEARLPPPPIWLRITARGKTLPAPVQHHDFDRRIQLGPLQRMQSSPTVDAPMGLRRSGRLSVIWATPL